MQFWIKLCNCVLVVGLLCGYQAIQNHRTQEEEIAKLEAQLQQQTTASEDTETVDSPYQDGVYEGEAQGYGGTVAVELTIENGKFTDLTVVSAEKEDAAYFDAASSLLDTILEEQSTDMDTVSGATFSSNGIIHATEDALRKAEKSECRKKTFQHKSCTLTFEQRFKSCFFYVFHLPLPLLFLQLKAFLHKLAVTHRLHGVRF